MAPEAAATAPRAQYQAPEKLTDRDMPKQSTKANQFRVAARPSLRSSIDRMCKSCIYDPGNGNGGWREQVAACSSSNCPLHSVRPLPVKATNPAVEHRNGADGMIDAADAEHPQIGAKIGSNDEAEERRAA
jgi:hypothetical protein